jgi:coatomer protein complex subunit gamma
MEVATGLVRNATPVPVQEIKVDIIETLMQVPQLAKLGAPMKSSLVNPLTEAETEYVVNCYKHLYKNHLVLQVLVFDSV